MEMTLKMLETKPRPDLLAKTLDATITEFETALGPDKGRWRYGNIHFLYLKHAAIEKEFDRGPIPLGGDASTIITTFPFRKPAIYGRRGTNQTRTIMQSIPVGASDYWVDRLNGAGVPASKGSRFGLTRVMFLHPCGIPHELVENPGDTRPAIVNASAGTTAQVAI